MTDKPPPQYLTFNLKYLSISGLWNPYDDNRKWFYYIYTFIISFVIMVIRIQGYINQIRQFDDDFLKSTTVSFVVASLTTGLIKNFNTLWHRNEIRYLKTALQWELKLPCSTTLDVYRRAIIHNATKTSKIFTIIWIVEAIFCLITFYCHTFDVNHRTISEICIGYTSLRYYIETWNFGILLLIDYIMLLLCSCTVMANDCLTLCIMFHIAAQLKILNFRLNRCCLSLVEVPPRETSNYTDLDGSNFSQNHGKLDTRESNQELIYCIQHYQHIVRMVKVTQGIYGIIIFPQLLTSVMMIAFTGIHIFVTKTVSKDDPLSAILVFLSLGSSLYQITAYCWGGNTVTEGSDLTSLAAYKSHWYLADQVFQSNFMIFCMISKKPLTISSYGLFDLSFITLKNVVAKAYSGMALVKKANE